MKSRTSLNIICLLLALALAPLAASAVVSGVPLSAEDVEQRDTDRLKWEESMATPAYYWAVLVAGVLVASVGLHKLAQRRQLTFRPWMHCGAILMFVMFVSVYFLARHTVLETIGPQGPFSPWRTGPCRLAGLPFLLGSSPLGAAALIMMWAIGHPAVLLKGAAESTTKQYFLATIILLLCLVTFSFLLWTVLALGGACIAVG